MEKTKILKLKNNVLENYSIRNIDNIKEIPHSNVNSLNLLLTNNSKNYVLHKFQDNSTSQRIEKMCAIIDFCSKKGIKVSEPIKNKNNKFYTNGYYITKFHQGKFSNNSLIEIKNLATSIAHLHRCLSKIKINYNFKPKSKLYAYLSKNELSKIQSLIHSKHNLDATNKMLAKNFDFVVQQMSDCKKLEKQLKNKNFSKQLIHGDFNPSNVIFNNHDVAAILDFNQMRKGLVIEDVSFASIRFSYKSNFSKKSLSSRIEKFLYEYQKINPIETNQYQYFHFFLKRPFVNALNYILRSKYLTKNNLWENDFKKNLKFLKIAQSLENEIF